MELHCVRWSEPASSISTAGKETDFTQFYHLKDIFSTSDGVNHLRRFLLQGRKQTPDLVDANEVVRGSLYNPEDEKDYIIGNTKIV